MRRAERMRRRELVDAQHSGATLSELIGRGRAACAEPKDYDVVCHSDRRRAAIDPQHLSRRVAALHQVKVGLGHLLRLADTRQWLALSHFQETAFTHIRGDRIPHVGANAGWAHSIDPYWRQVDRQPANQVFDPARHRGAERRALARAMRYRSVRQRDRRTFAKVFVLMLYTSHRTPEAHRKQFSRLIEIDLLDRTGVAELPPIARGEHQMVERSDLGEERLDARLLTHIDRDGFRALQLPGNRTQFVCTTRTDNDLGAFGHRALRHGQPDARCSANHRHALLPQAPARSPSPLTPSRIGRDACPNDTTPTITRRTPWSPSPANAAKRASPNACSISRWMASAYPP